MCWVCTKQSIKKCTNPWVSMLVAWQPHDDRSPGNYYTLNVLMYVRYSTGIWLCVANIVQCLMDDRKGCDGTSYRACTCSYTCSNQHPHWYKHTLTYCLSAFIMLVCIHSAHALAVFASITHTHIHTDAHNNLQPIILSLIILHAALYGDYCDLSLHSISFSLPLPAHHLGGF